MVDLLYKPEDVDDEVRRIFEQLRSEFGGEFQIWRRAENFGLWVSAGVVNPARRTAVTVALTGTKSRTALLGPEEIGRIREHLTSGGEQVLAL